VSDIEEVHMSVPQRNMDNLLKNRETCEDNSPVTDDNINNSTGKQEVESKVQDDESQGFQPPGRTTDLETTKVLDVASEPVSVLGGAQEADQQAENAVMPQLSRSFSDPPPSPAKRCKTLCLNHAGAMRKYV
jgi:hypothetical protein